MRARPLPTLLLAAGVLIATGCGTFETRYYMAEGNKLYKAQKYDEAIAYYRKILGIDSRNWPANYQIAMSYLAMYHPGSTHPKDLEYANKSVEAFETLLKLQAPDQETTDKVRNYYVALLVAADKAEKIVAYYNELLAKDPSNGMYMVQFAQYYAKKGDFENALKWFEKRCEVEPKNKEAWYTVGVVCWEHSYKGGTLVSDPDREVAIDKGFRALDHAMKLDPDYFEALAYVKLLWLEKMKLLQNQGKNAEAGEAYQKSEEVNAQIAELRKKKGAQTPGAAAKPG